MKSQWRHISGAEYQEIKEQALKATEEAVAKRPTEGFAPIEDTKLYWVYGVFTVRATDKDDAERGIAVMHDLEVEGAKHWNGEGIDFAFMQIKEANEELDYDPTDQGGQS